MRAAAAWAGTANRVVVGIGEYAVADGDTEIVTHALGSCVAVCLWDEAASVGALLHFLLPGARVSPTRAAIQPAAFADTGIPLLFQAAYRKGAVKERCRVWIVGGADTQPPAAVGPRPAAVPQPGALEVGRRNILAAKNLLWRNGVLLAGEQVGGSIPRTVTLAAGRLVVKSPGLPPVVLA